MCFTSYSVENILKYSFDFLDKKNNYILRIVSIDKFNKLFFDLKEKIGDSINEKI